MRRGEAAVIMVLMGLGVAACSRGTPPASQPPTQPSRVQTLEVSMREWGFDPSPLVGKSGKITFRIKNDGGVEHNFLVEGKPGAEIEAIQPSAVKMLTTDLTPGQYTIFCNLPGHREAGMVGTLKIE